MSDKYLLSMHNMNSVNKLVATRRGSSASIVHPIQAGTNIRKAIDRLMGSHISLLGIYYFTIDMLPDRVFTVLPGHHNLVEEYMRKIRADRPVTTIPLFLPSSVTEDHIRTTCREGKPERHQMALSIMSGRGPISRRACLIDATANPDYNPEGCAPLFSSYGYGSTLYYDAAANADDVDTAHKCYAQRRVYVPVSRTYTLQLPLGAFQFGTEAITLQKQ